MQTDYVVHTLSEILSIFDITDIISLMGGFLGTLSAIYVYLENRRFRELEAEKEFRIVSAELQQLDSSYENEHSQLKKHYEKRINDYFSTQEEEAALSRELHQKEVKFFNEREKILAKADYYKEIKNHSFFRFFKKEEINPDDPFNLNRPKSFFKRMLRKIEKLYSRY